MTGPVYDIEGTEVKVGDIVWVIEKGYRNFIEAKIVKITPTGFKVVQKIPNENKYNERYEYFVTELIKKREKDAYRRSW